MTATPGLPPGPPLPRTVQMALLLRYWPRFITACRRRYGDVFTLRVAGLGPPLVYLADPADIKTVFAGDPAIYHAGQANSVLSGLLGETSVLVIDGDVHRDRRRLMMAPFAREAVARQNELIAQIAADNIAGWPVDEDFPVAPKMAQITLEVILRTVIGASDPDRLAALRAIMPRLLSLGPWSTLAIARPHLSTDCRGGICAAASRRPTRCCTPRSPSAGPIPIWPSAPTPWPCWCAPPMRTAGT